VRFDNFLEPAVLAWLRRTLASARFVTRVHKDLVPPATDIALEDPPLQSKLFLLMNDAALFRTIESVTGCSTIGCYLPIVMRRDPGEAHHDSWHTDADGNRLIALSVNVGGAFEGSALRMREQGGRPLFEGSNAEPNSALLFRIAPTLEHCLAPLQGTRSRTVLGGWFQRHPAVSARWPVTLPV
jgi:hypothetical protein